MISAATGRDGAFDEALWCTDHGVQYLFAATILTGVIQFVLSYFKIGGLMQFVSKAVMTGFVNALAIVIFLAQLPELGISKDIDMSSFSVWMDTWGTSWVLAAAGLAIIYLFPLLTKAVPSPLICIIVLTVVSKVMGLDVRTVGTLGDLPDALPSFALPQVPFAFETFKIIIPVAFSLVAVGLLESFMTAQIVDDLTDTHFR